MIRRRNSLSGSPLVAILITCSLLFFPQRGKSDEKALTSPEDLASRIDELMARTYKPETTGAVILVVRGGKIVLRKAYGLADLELGTPLVPEMVFGIGSMTKMFTATAVMMLAEASALDYGDPVSKYLGDAPPIWKDITIDHLLSHTSGLVDLFAVPEWMAQWKEDVSPKDLTAFFRDKPLQFEPAARAAYCNSNYVLLGRIVERVSGQALGQFVTERVLDPLRMKNTYFSIQAEDLVPRRAKGYVFYPDGSFKNPPYISWTQAYAVGTMLSCVDDLAKFVTALFEGNLLKSDTLQKVLIPRTLRDGKMSPYGYGNLFVFVEGVAPMVRISGTSLGYEVYSLYLRDEKAYVAIFTNTSNYGPGAKNPYFPGPLVREIAAMVRKSE